MDDIDNHIRKTHILCYTFFVYLVILFTFPITVNAQVGIKIGTTASSFYYTGSKPTPYLGYDIDLRPYLGYDIELVQIGDQKPLFSPYISIYYTFSISQRIFVRSELGYIQKGVNFNQFDYERIIYKVKISYLEIPLSVTYQFIQKENSISEIYFGGYGSCKINSMKKVSSHNSSIENIKINSVKKFEGGLHLGINYKHKFFNDFFLIDLRFLMGLTNIFVLPDDWTSIYFNTQETKTTCINLSVGYEF